MERGDVGKVRQAFSRLGVPLDHVQIIPGWFEATLKNALLTRIALLHIDADWYDLVKLVLEELYAKVVPGGFIVLYDYRRWEGCNRALADFTSGHQLKDITFVKVGRVGASFQKPS